MDVTAFQLPFAPELRVAYQPVGSSCEGTVPAETDYPECECVDLDALQEAIRLAGLDGDDLEDALDLADLEAALDDPENATGRIALDDLRRELDL